MIIFFIDEQEKVEAATAIVISSDDEDIVTEYSRRPLICKHFDNLNLIIKFSNATMIHKQTAEGYFCSYCTEPFVEPRDLKEHTLTVHEKEKEVVYSNIKSPTALLVKLDITNLKCIICNDNIDSLDDLINHLSVKHDKKFHNDMKNQIFPFKFDTEELKCCLCTNDGIFTTFRTLHEHMHKHYRYHVCEECDVGFINLASLKNHAMVHKKGNFVCKHCPLVFDKMSKRSHHQTFAHKEESEINKCDFCNQGFRNAIHKRAHLVAKHGVAPLKYDCKTCDRTFSSSSRLSVHVRRFHLQERLHKCSECDKRFFRTSDLKSHLLVHTGAKNYKCEVCSKFLATQSILNKHMRIHTNDRRFKCAICEQAFIQKPSLNWHMKKHANAY